MASKGMPQDEILGIPAHKYLLCGAIIFLILGGLSVAAGLKARLGACMLFLFLIGATYYFHDFWNAEAQRSFATLAICKISNEVCHNLYSTKTQNFKKFRTRDYKVDENQIQTLSRA